MNRPPSDQQPQPGATREVARAAVFDHATGTSRAVDSPVFKRLDASKMKAVLMQVGIVPKDGDTSFVSHVLLTTRNGWVDGKGYIDALNPRAVWMEGDRMDFVPETNQPTGRLDAWLHGLEAGASYLARIEVGASVDAVYDVKATTLGAPNSHQVISTNGGFDTLFLPFSGGDGGLGLLRIESPDWSFYELEVSKMEM